jgi:putative peptide zinc metalloprotease protein
METTRPMERPRRAVGRSLDGRGSAAGAGDKRPEAQPELADGIELLGEFEDSGYKRAPYLARRADGQVLQLTRLLHLVAEQLDGKQNPEEIARRVTDKYGRQVSADNVAFLVEEKLRPLGVVKAKDGSSPELRKADPLLALRLKTVLVPERAVGVLTKVFRPLFWPPVIALVLAAFLALDVWFFGIHGVAQSIRHTLYAPGVVVLIYGLLVLSVGWHEVGHATACAYGGAKPGIIGFGVYVVWPAFYTDVTDAYRLGKGGRVRTDLGGIYFNMIFALFTAGAYFYTHYEPLLVLVLMQHLLIFYQFLPFLRLDGYYVISDLTGVPDLFARVKPTLQSLLPWKRTSDEVSALKTWVRVVVTAWVLMVVPLLLYGFAMMVITAPRVLATTFDSALIQWDKVRSAFADSDAAAVTAGSLQMSMLVLPVAGMSVTLTRVAKRLMSAGFRFTREKPFLRAGFLVLVAGLLASCAWILYPNGEYRPLQPDERGTLADSFTALSDVSEGRPSLSEPRQEELGGAPFSNRSAGGPGEAPLDISSNPESEDASGSTDSTSSDTDSSSTDSDQGVSPTPSPSPTPTTDASPTPTPEESPEPEVTPSPTPTEESE